MNYATHVNFSCRWRNWVIRGIFTWLMIGGFGLLIYMGPLYLAVIVSKIKGQVKVHSINFRWSLLSCLQLSLATYLVYVQVL